MAVDETCNFWLSGHVHTFSNFSRNWQCWLSSCLCPDAIFDVLSVHVFSDKHKNSKIPTTLVLISREYWMETFCLISRKVYLEGKSKSSKKVQFLEWMLKDSLESLFSVNAESSSRRWRGMPGVTCQLALHITALHVTMSRRTTSSLTSNLDCT